METRRLGRTDHLQTVTQVRVTDLFQLLADVARGTQRLQALPRVVTMLPHMLFHQSLQQLAALWRKGLLLLQQITL